MTSLYLTCSESKSPNNPKSANRHISKKQHLFPAIPIETLCCVLISWARAAVFAQFSAAGADHAARISEFILISERHL